MIATQYQSNIQVIHTDNGGEFINQDLKRYLNLHGIVHKTTCPYTPKKNRVAKQKNRHLLEVVRVFLFGAHMPTSYYGEAITTATYLINHIPSSSLQFQTLFDVLHHIVSALTILNLSPKVSGCVAFVHFHKGLRTKLEPRALQCVFVDALHKKGYQCYHPLLESFTLPLMWSFMKMICIILSLHFRGRIEMKCRLYIIFWTTWIL